MSPIKGMTVTYEALNEEDTFSEGDTVVGTVTFTLSKETKVKRVQIKIKGEARVHWSEGTGEKKRDYSANRQYFKLKEQLVSSDTKETVLPQGVHCFKFRFQIPENPMPSSFNGAHGKIIYVLEGKVSRSWRWPSTAEKQLNFQSRFLLQPGHAMCPSTGSVDKKIGVFSKGQVQLSATVDKKVCSPGDTLSIVAKISNSSAKKMKPKYSLQQKIVFYADGSTNSSDNSLCKIVGDTITPNSKETLACQLMIPDDVIYTLFNCDIISVDYYLKVYLDISFAFDPEVEFPLVIVPSKFNGFHTGEVMGPYPAGAFGPPSYSDFPPPAFPTGPYPVPTGPGAYAYPEPPQPGPTASGYSSQWPQQNPPFGFPAAAFPPPVAPQHPAPTAPSMLHQEEPPSYTSLFPPSHDTMSGQKC